MKIIKNGLNIFIQLIKFVFITFGIAFGLLFLISLYLDSWMTRRVQRKSYPSAATAMLATIAKECAQKKADGQINPTFNNIPKLDHYTFSPVNGDCNGDQNNLLSAISRKPSKYASFSYNVVTGKKTCFHDSPNDLYGCDKNGNW
tara:strand:- start:143 stop:577 length:435 start_codon:yes stop_codon:yes gene_type:complete